MAARTALAVTLVASLASAPAGAEGPNGASAEALMAALTHQTRLRLADEGVVLLEAREDDGSVEGLVLFNLPVEETWQLLAQGERQREYRDDLESLETVATHESGTIDEHRLRIMFIRIAYRLRYDLDETHRSIRWALDPEFDNGLEEVSGSWRLFGLASGRTLGQFATRVRLGGALPSRLQDSVTRKRVPETLRRCRLWVDSRGSWRP